MYTYECTVCAETMYVKTVVTTLEFASDSCPKSATIQPLAPTLESSRSTKKAELYGLYGLVIANLVPGAQIVRNH